jgi:hypothetical protein
MVSGRVDRADDELAVDRVRFQVGVLRPKELLDLRVRHLAAERRDHVADELPYRRSIGGGAHGPLAFVLVWTPGCTARPDDLITRGVGRAPAQSSCSTCQASNAVGAFVNGAMLPQVIAGFVNGRCRVRTTASCPTPARGPDAEAMTASKVRETFVQLLWPTGDQPKRTVVALRSGRSRRPHAPRLRPMQGGP